jgi:hypothetical protein
MNARLATLLCSSLLVSCGGSITSAGIGGTGITSGEITGFGSVFVNGVKFNTDASEFEVDGDIFATQLEAVAAGLAEGMVAKIYGTTDSNGLTGTADLVVYDDDIEGPITSPPIDVVGSGGSQKSFTIFNQTVIIDQNNTFFNNTNFGDVAINDIIEVSGLPISDTEVLATYVKWKEVLNKGNSIVELSGLIDTHNSLLKTFTLGGTTITIDYSSMLPEEIQVTGGVLDTGLFVEVEGRYEIDDTITAIEIEEEDDDFGSDIDHISLEGIIYKFTDTMTLLFTIDSQPVDASGAVFLNSNEVAFFPTTELSDGVRVMVSESKSRVLSAAAFSSPTK